MLSADELTEAAVGAATVPLSAERPPPTANSAAAAVVMRSAGDAIEAVAAAPEPKSEQAAAAILAAPAGTKPVPPSDSWVIAFSLIGHNMGSWDHVPSSNQHWCVMHTDGSLVAL